MSLDRIRAIHGDSREARCADLNAGLAAEHLVCADLLLSGHRAFITAQSCPYDVAVEIGGKLIRVQVKATRTLRHVPQRAQPVTAYLFHTKRAGKGGKRQYGAGEFDMYALVALDVRAIAYWSAHRVVLQTIQLKPPGTKQHLLRKHRNIDEYPFREALGELLNG